MKIEQNVDVVSIGGSRTFSLTESKQLLPLISSITDSYSEKLKYLISQKEAFKFKSSELAAQIEEEQQQLVNEWQRKMFMLGVYPKGVWLVDFDNGHGYYCWKFPEADILFQHGYNDGFTKRTSVAYENSDLSN